MDRFIIINALFCSIFLSCFGQSETSKYETVHNDTGYFVIYDYEIIEFIPAKIDTTEDIYSNFKTSNLGIGFVYDLYPDIISGGGWKKPLFDKVRDYSKPLMFDSTNLFKAGEQRIKMLPAKFSYIEKKPFDEWEEKMQNEISTVSIYIKGEKVLVRCNNKEIEEISLEILKLKYK